MMAVSLNWDSIYIIQLQSISPKKTRIFDIQRMSNGFSDHRSTLAHDVVLVPQHRCRSTGARCTNPTGRLAGDIAWFLLDHITLW